MSLLDWDYDEIAYRVQTGLDRLTVSFFRHHGARVRRDEVDFHGYEHLELEVAHDGHRLRVRQYARARGLEETPPGRNEPYPTEELTSTFDDQPASAVPTERLARWLASLPAGQAASTPDLPPPDPTNPFAPPPRRAGGPQPPAPSHNPFLTERPAAPGPNPFAPPSPEEKRQRALDWLRSDDD